MLNAEQLAAVNAHTGAWKVESCAGTGKTRVITERYKRLRGEGISESELLSLTFTKAAADEMRERAGATKGGRGGFRTFHSFALHLLTEERAHLPFHLADDPIPHDGKIPALLKKLLRDFMGVRYREARDYISLQKRNGITPAAAIAAAGFDIVGFRLASLYAEYERRMRAEGWLDFDSIQFEALRLLEAKYDVKCRWNFRFVQCDEAQDCDALQWQILKQITAGYGNVFCVGDGNQALYGWRGAATEQFLQLENIFPNLQTLYLGLNYRCHPPGVLIDCCTAMSGRPGRKCQISEVPVEGIATEHRAVSWDRRSWYFQLRGRRTDVEVSRFRGQLVTIATARNSVPVTPNHRVLVRFNESATNKYVIYLMWRSDLGFSVGRCALAKPFGTQGKRVIRLWHRLHRQRAEKFWILCVTDDPRKAVVQEAIVAAKYGITETEFCSEGSKQSRFTRSEIAQIFAAVGNVGGFACLEAHGLLFNEPLLRTNGRVMKGYLLTAACNALPVIMSVPTRENPSGEPITDISKTEYDGPVYSLEVEKDHTYIANGIIVGNSTHQIVDYCREIAPVRTPLIEKMRANNGAEGPAPEFRQYLDDLEEAFEVVGEVADPSRTAILCRCNRQLRAFEDECIRRQIRYNLLGRSGFWQRGEVQDLLAFVRVAVAPWDDAAVARIIRGPYPCSKYLGAAFVKRLPKPYFTSLKTYYDPAVKPYQLEAAKKLHTFLTGLRASVSPTMSAERAVRIVSDQSGMLAYYSRREDDSEEAADNMAAENLEGVAEAASRFANTDELLRHANRAVQAAKNAQGLTLSTVHQAKGKEWETVYVCGVSDEILPHAKGDFEEEQRIYYVACSRPARRLIVTCHGRPSVFIRERVENLQNSISVSEMAEERFA